MWKLDTGVMFLQPKSDRFKARCAAFSPDSSKLFLGGFQNQIWDLVTGNRLAEWKHGSGDPKALTVTADGQTLISCDGKELHYFEATSGKHLKSEPLAPGNGNYFQGRLAAVGDRGVFAKNLQSLDVFSLTNPTNIAIRPAPNNSFALSANGKRVAVADSSNKQVAVWDADSNQIVDQWPVDTIAAQTVAISHDGKFVLTCGYHRVVQLWEMTE